MVKNESVTLAKVYADYAKAVGHEPLTDKEKQQAYLNAILEGKQVEPFAILSGWWKSWRDFTKDLADWMAEQHDIE